MRCFRWFSNSSHVRPVKEGLLLGVLCAALVYNAHALGWLRVLEQSALDVLFRARGLRYPHPQIVILVADDATVARIGQWPLPRRVYAEVVRRLDHAGAKTIAFDVQFSWPSGDASSDEEFRRACYRAQRVVQTTVFHVPLPRYPTSPLSMSTVASPLPRFRVSEKGTEQPAYSRSAAWATAARPTLQSSAVALGHVNVYPEPNGELQRIPHLIRYRGAVYPSLALATAAHFLNLKPHEIVAGGAEVRLPIKDSVRRIPIDRNGEAWINWAGGNQRFPTYTFNELLDGRVASEQLKGCVVLVGVTAAGAFEHHATPFSPVQPGVELQASALDDILSNRPLREVPVVTQLALLFGFPVLVGGCSAFWLARRGALGSTLWTLALSVALALTAFILLSRNDLYVPLAAPLIAALLTSGVSIGYHQIRDARQLKQAEQRYALAVRGANDGLWDWNLQTNDIYFSPHWKTIVGCAEMEIDGRPDEWFQRVHPEDISRVKRQIESHLAGDSPHFESEYRMLHKDGSYRWVLCRGLKVESKQRELNRMAGSLTDVTERKKVEDDLENSREQLRALAARLDSVQEAERTRIAREVHDGLGQALTALKIDLLWMGRNLSLLAQPDLQPKWDSSLQQRIRSMSQLVDTTIESVQQISTRLRPGVLDDLGLEAAIEWQIQDFQSRTGIRCRFISNLSSTNADHVDRERSTAVFRILQEALTNVARHANATRVTVNLCEKASDLMLEVRDNGRGVAAHEIDSVTSLGLLGMSERALLVGGEVKIRGMKDQGTTIIVRIPLDECKTECRKQE